LTEGIELRLESSNFSQKLVATQGLFFEFGLINFLMLKTLVDTIHKGLQSLRKFSEFRTRRKFAQFVEQFLHFKDNGVVLFYGFKQIYAEYLVSKLRQKVFLRSL